MVSCGLEAVYTGWRKQYFHITCFQINYDVKKAKAGAAIEFDMDQFQADAEAAAAERAAAGIANFEPDPYDGHLNHQELSKTLLDLSALYREAHRLGVSCDFAFVDQCNSAAQIINVLSCALLHTIAPLGLDRSLQGSTQAMGEFKDVLTTVDQCSPATRLMPSSCMACWQIGSSY